MKTVCILEGNIKERRSRLEQIKASLPGHELFIFDKEDHYEYVSQMISEISCFGERRIFVIKELPRIDIQSKLKNAKAKENDTKSQMRTKVLNNFKKTFVDIPMGNIVIFDNIGITSAGFIKEANKYGSVFQFKQKILKTDAKIIICDYFKHHKIDVDKDISDVIANSLNALGMDVDIDKLSLLMLKLYHYVYGRTTITKKDVYAVCSVSRDFVVWSLYNILDGSDGEDITTKYGRSFVMAYDFLLNSRYFNHEATMLLQSMLWRYGLLLMGKSSIEKRIPKKDIEKEIENIRKLKSEGKDKRIKMSPKEDKPEYSDKMVNSILYQRRGVDLLSCYTYDELLSIYHVISKSLVKIRSGCTNAEMLTLLQLTFLTICGELKCQTSSESILYPKKMIRKEV